MSNAIDSLDKALLIVTQEVEKLFVKSKDVKPLDRSEASALTDYIKTLVIVRKDERDAIKSDPMSSKTDDELKDLAKQALEYLKSQEEPDEQQPSTEPSTEPSEVSSPVPK
jgi:hypothetical protein